MSVRKAATSSSGATMTTTQSILSPVPPVPGIRRSKRISRQHKAEAVYSEPKPASSRPPGDESSEPSSLTEDDSPRVPSSLPSKRQARSTKAALKRGRVETQSTRPEADVVIQESKNAMARTDDKPRRVKIAKRKTKSQFVITSEEDFVRENPEPNFRRKRKAMTQASEEVLMVPIEQVHENARKPAETRAKRKRMAAERPAAKGDFDAASDSEDRKPTKRSLRQAQAQVVYDVPDVERKTTTFRGRLGYACLNTILRAQKPDSVFCSRTCRLETIEKNGMQFVYDLALRNVRDLGKLVEWNEANNIKFMRVSSEMFPFASHPKYGYNLAFADEELKSVGRLANSLGHRLTAHPGQFTQLGSPKENVVTQSISELEYHCEMMDRMDLGVDSVMIIHMGGVYGDKQATLERFKHNYTTLLSDRVKARLVLENDEICYNLDDLIPVCDPLNIPIVVDYHHDWINPSSRSLTELIPIVNETWRRRGIKVKQHHSEPRPGAESVMEKRAHADRCQSLPQGLPDDIDLMIEAKDKEQAVFELYRIYDLAPVIRENLRPPNPTPTLATAGRKSNAKQRKLRRTLLKDAAGDELNAD